MSMYRPRLAEHTLRRYLGAFPVVGMTGPRQSGKSTLLLNTLPDYTYVTFDNPGNVKAFTEDPEGFLRQYNSQIIFDEVQYVPEIFHYLKIAADKDRSHYGKFVVTGSSQFDAMKKISESLAGRIGLFSLLPFQYAELPDAAHHKAIYKGSYPELVERNYADNDLWYAAYIDTYLNKDVRAVSNIGDIRDFQRLLSLLAANTAQILDMSSYARDLGVSVPTIKRWISVLEASYIIFLLPPYYSNFGKRIVKSPKVYFWDTGLVAHLTGIKDEETYEKGPMAGSLFENYIVADVYKQQLHIKSQRELFYLRTSDQLEIDLIVDAKQTKELIEIKKSATFSNKMLTPIKKFITNQDKGYLLYNGEEKLPQDNISILPYARYLKKTYQN